MSTKYAWRDPIGDAIAKRRNAEFAAAVEGSERWKRLTSQPEPKRDPARVEMSVEECVHWLLNASLGATAPTAQHEARFAADNVIRGDRRALMRSARYAEWRSGRGDHECTSREFAAIAALCVASIRALRRGTIERERAGRLG